MPDVHQAPGGGKGAAASAVPTPEAWFAALRDDIDDLYAAAEDATRPPAKRDLGRRLARKHILASARSLRTLLASPPPPFTPLPSAPRRARP
jgi:hypothetical protein